MAPEYDLANGGTERRFASLFLPVLRAGLLGSSMSPRGADSPTALTLRAWEAYAKRALRGAPDAMDLYLTVVPLASLRESIDEKPTRRDETRAVVLLDAGICRVITLEAVVDAWGEEAAAASVQALTRGLGRVVNVSTPDDFEMQLEYYAECLGSSDDDDRDYYVSHIAEIEEARSLVRRLDARPATRAALRTLPEGQVRRAAAALLSPRRGAPRASRAEEKLLEEIQRAEDYGWPTSAVLLCAEVHDAVQHTYDEWMEQTMNSGMSSAYHRAVLIDTSSTLRLRASLRRLARVLRALAHAERLVYALQGIHDDTTPS